MELIPGAVLEGTVKSIANFGAFINLPEGKTGLVHISEIASVYVSDVRQHLSEGQSVKVKVLSIDDRGRVSLSIRQAESKPERVSRKPRPQTVLPLRQPAVIPVEKNEPESFEDKLKHFMADSNKRISGVRQYEHKTRSRKR